MTTNEQPKSNTPTPKSDAIPASAKQGKLEPNTSASSAPVVKTPDPEKRVSHLKLGPALLRKHATQTEIDKAFTESFNKRGVKDKVFISKRIAIYMKIAAKKVAAEKAVKKAAKTVAA
jgi:hypothetical protein